MCPSFSRVSFFFYGIDPVFSKLRLLAPSLCGIPDTGTHGITDRLYKKLIICLDAPLFQAALSLTGVRLRTRVSRNSSTLVTLLQKDLGKTIDGKGDRRVREVIKSDQERPPFAAPF